jgi:hypothetical protein
MYHGALFVAGGPSFLLSHILRRVTDQRVSCKDCCVTFITIGGAIYRVFKKELYDGIPNVTVNVTRSTH